MKVGAAIAEILKREGVEILLGYPVNHLIEFAAAADIRPIMVRQERIGLHMADAISRMTSGRKLGRVLHAVRAGNRECLRRHRPGLCRIGADPGHARRLCPPHRPRCAELSRGHADARHHQIGRAGPLPQPRSPTSCAAHSRACATAAAVRSWSRSRTICGTRSCRVALDYTPVLHQPLRPRARCRSRRRRACWPRPSARSSMRGRACTRPGPGRSCASSRSFLARRSRPALGARARFPRTTRCRSAPAASPFRSRCATSSTRRT